MLVSKRSAPRRSAPLRFARSKLAPRRFAAASSAPEKSAPTRVAASKLAAARMAPEKIRPLRSRPLKSARSPPRAPLLTQVSCSRSFAASPSSVIPVRVAILAVLRSMAERSVSASAAPRRSASARSAPRRLALTNSAPWKWAARMSALARFVLSSSAPLKLTFLSLLLARFVWRRVAPRKVLAMAWPTALVSSSMIAHSRKSAPSSLAPVRFAPSKTAERRFAFSKLAPLRSASRKLAANNWAKRKLVRNNVALVKSQEISSELLKFMSLKSSFLRSQLRNTIRRPLRTPSMKCLWKWCRRLSAGCVRPTPDRMRERFAFSSFGSSFGVRAMSIQLPLLIALRGAVLPLGRRAVAPAPEKYLPSGGGALNPAERVIAGMNLGSDD